MKRKTNKTKEEAWSQTAHAPDGEQPGPEASDTSGQSVPKSKFRKKSQQEQAAAAKLHMESQGEKLEQAREKLAKQKPPKKPGPVKRIGRVASGSVHSFVHGKIFEVEQENVGTEGAHRSELVGETALRHGSRFVRRKVREHPAKVVRKAEAAIPSTRRTTISHRRTGAPGADEKCAYPLLAEATAPQAISQAGKGGCKAGRGCGWENCHSHRTPDRPGSGICQKSSRRCRGCGALCVTPVCYAVLFLYHAYAGERRGRCIRGQHLSLRGSGYAGRRSCLLCAGR